MKNYKLWIVAALILIIGCRTTSFTRQASVEAERSAEWTAQESVTEDTSGFSYVNRLEEVDEQMEKLFAGASTTNSLKSAAEQERKTWEAELQRIMEILAKHLPEEEKTELIREQKMWMRDREDLALEASSGQRTSAMEELEYILSHSETTRDRTYELAEQYAVILAETD